MGGVAKVEAVMVVATEEVKGEAAWMGRAAKVVVAALKAVAMGEAGRRRRGGWRVWRRSGGGDGVGEGGGDGGGGEGGGGDAEGGSFGGVRDAWRREIRCPRRPCCCPRIRL